MDLQRRKTISAEREKEKNIKESRTRRWGRLFKGSCLKECLKGILSCNTSGGIVRVLVFQDKGCSLCINTSKTREMKRNTNKKKKWNKLLWLMVN